jgi:hypothetical protein
VQQRDAARQVIEHQHGFWRHVVQVRHRVVGARMRRQSLEIAHHVVRRVADETARERHPRHFRQWLGRRGQRLAQRV